MHLWGPSAPTTPRLAHSLRVLAAAVDVRWPHRLRGSDGWIGDVRHQHEVSDHNPDARGIVHAIDLTAARCDPWLIVVAAVAHPSTHYVIYDTWIWDRSRGFRPEHYTGPDPHVTHVHVSISPTVRAERSKRRWL